MAKAKRATPARPPKAAARQPADPGQVAIDAAMRLAAERGWRKVTLSAVAEEAGIGLAELYRRYPSRAAILAGFTRRIDTQVLEQGRAEDDGESARDRLFEVMMRRYEALRPYREAIASIVEDSPRDPLSLLCMAGPMRRSMAWMLEAAGLSASGPAGLLKTKGLALVHGWVMRTWLNDDSADLAKTMAALDRALKQAEPVANCLFGRRRSPDSPPGPVESVAN